MYSLRTHCTLCQVVRSLGAEFPAISVTSWVGHIMLLLDNPYHKEELYRLGITPATAFPCAVKFLLRLRPAVLAPFADELRRLSNPAVLTIGIQIRVGDAALAPGGANATLALYAAFFRCAAQIEAARQRAPDQLVLYYLISDSLQLRRAAADALGAKLLTSLWTPLRHTRYFRGPADQQQESFRAAVAEAWLFSLTQYQVVGRNSRFGSLGAFMSGRFHQAYTIDLPKATAGQRQEVIAAVPRSCSAYQYESMEYVTPHSTSWASAGP